MSDVYIGLSGINGEENMSLTLVDQTDYTTSGQLSSYEEVEIVLPRIENEDPLQKERSYFESIRSELMKDPKMKDGSVAILGEKVIGHGPKGAELAIQMYKEHGYVPIFIEKVSEDIKYTSSPRIE